MLCVRCAPSDSRAESDASGKSSAPATEVSIAAASVRPFEYLIYTSGKVVSANEVRVQFRRTGVIQSILVENGKPVKKGDLIAVLDNQIQQLALSKAKVNADEK